MRNESLEHYLDSLAARVAAPGGGASAALHVAQGAALVAMVGRYSDGPKYAADAELIAGCVAAADVLRRTALDLVEADAVAFAGVAAAYAAPKATDVDRVVRSAAIADALAGAARPAVDVVEAAREVVRLAAALLPAANRNLISDLAAAAEAARAGAATARVNIVVNLSGMEDAAALAEFSAVADSVDPLLTEADVLSAAVLGEVSR